MHATTLLVAVVGMGSGNSQVGGQRPGNYNQVGRPTIVVSAPTVANTYYRPFWSDIIRFMGSYAEKIMSTGNDNVIVLGDRRSLAQLRQFYPRLPPDVTMEAELEDIWMRDHTAARMSRPVAFTFAPNYMGRYEQRLIQNAFEQFISACGINIPKVPIVMDGGNVVDNDVDKGIVTSRIYEDNPNYNPDRLVQDIKQALGYNQLAVISEYPGDTTGHSDGMVSFIDTNTVAMTDLGPPEHEKVRGEIRQQLPGVNIVDIGGFYKDETWQGFSSACGLHINLLATDTTLYVPTFGDDQDNRVNGRGQSPQLDAQILQQIGSMTSKTVVGVPVPQKVCRMGGNVRCLSWQTKGSVADTLVRRAQSGGCPSRSNFGK